MSAGAMGRTSFGSAHFPGRGDVQPTGKAVLRWGGPWGALEPTSPAC